MLENVDLSQAIANEEYKKSMKTLEVKLGELQRRAWELKIPIILVFEGWHASGMGEDINRFILPLDPRGFDFHTMTRPCYDDRLKPFLLRFWELIPVKGRIGIFDRSWYSRAIIEFFGKEKGEKGEKALEKILEEITYFERQLADDGYLILKFFLHIVRKNRKSVSRKSKKRIFLLFSMNMKEKTEKNWILSSNIMNTCLL